MTGGHLLRYRHGKGGYSTRECRVSYRNHTLPFVFNDSQLAAL